MWAMIVRDPQRAGPAPPHVASDEFSRLTGDRELFAFVSGPAACVGGVPLMRARNP